MHLEPGKGAELAQSLDTSFSIKAANSWKKPTAIGIVVAAGAAGYALSQHEFLPEPIAAVAEAQRTQSEAEAEKLALPQKFDHHLHQLNSDMGALRTETVWDAYTHQQLSNVPTAALLHELDKFDEVLAAAKRDSYFEHVVTLLGEAEKHSAVLRENVPKIAGHAEPSAKEMSDFNEARSFFRALEHNFDTFEALLKEFRESPEFRPDVDLRPQIKSARSIIVQPNAEPVTGSLSADMPVTNLLFHLNFLSREQRIELTKRIIENERTRVVDVKAVNEPGYSDWVLYINVEQLVDLKTESKWVPLTLRQTTERINTASIAKKIGVALGTNTDCGLIIRNTLVEESEVSDFLSTSNYNTCLSVFADPNDPKRTLLTFADDIEMTFYKKTGAGFLDVAYRAVAKATSAKQLEITRDVTLRQAARNMQGIAAEGGKFLERPAGLQP